MPIIPTVQACVVTNITVDLAKYTKARQRDLESLETFAPRNQANLSGVQALLSMMQCQGCACYGSLARELKRTYSTPGPAMTRTLTVRNTIVMQGLGIPAAFDAFPNLGYR